MNMIDSDGRFCLTSYKEFDQYCKVLEIPAYLYGYAIAPVLEVKAISAGAFCGNDTYCEKLILPPTCDEIQESAFTYLPNLVYADLRYVKTIGREAFKKSKNLECVRLHPDCKIDQYAFSGCTKLKEIHIGNMRISVNGPAESFIELTFSKNL